MPPALVEILGEEDVLNDEGNVAEIRGNLPTELRQMIWSQLEHTLMSRGDAEKHRVNLMRTRTTFQKTWEGETFSTYNFH